MRTLDLIPRTEKDTLKFRLLAVAAVALAFLYQGSDAPLFPTLGIVGGYLAYSYVLRTFLIPRFISYPLLAAMVLADVGTTVAALYLIGLDSPVFGLLPIVVVYYALYLGYTGGIAAAILSTAGYTGLVFGTSQVDEMRNILAIQPVFYVLALLVGYLAQQRFHETEERQSLQQLISAEANARSLMDLAQALNRVIDPARISSDVARIGAIMARVPYCVIFTHDAEKDRLVYAGSNLPEGSLAGNGKEEFVQTQDRSSFLYAAWTRGRFAFQDEQGGERDEMAQWLGELDAGKAVACLLGSREDKVGVVCFAGTNSNPDFSEETMEAIEAFSEVAGRLLGGIHLYSQAEKRSRKVAAELQQSIESAGRFRELTQRRTMRFGPLLIEPSRESVRWQDTSLRLTKTEFDLLYALADKSGSVVNQETLIREAWGPDFVPQGKVVDVTIYRLRRKLASLPQGNKLIQTVRGQGYSFVPPERFVGTS